MKLKTEKTEFASNMGTGKRLSILATSKAMNVLSKGIYSRPLEAVVREIATNAYDAHVEAGIPEVPFEVSLPTNLKPEFSIRDFGLGIDSSKIRSVFATYFASDKTESNDYTGMLGLGALSPLAVASQFTVEVWRDGYYCVWPIYKDSDGFPNMNDDPLIRREMKEGEKTGVRISLPVQHHQIPEITLLCQKVYSVFKTLPKITNGAQIYRPKVISKFKTFWIEEGKGAYALMGNVLYPISKDVSDFNNLALNGRYVIPFEIGELDFEASREGLQYSDEVKRALIKKYQEVIQDISESIIKGLADSKSPWSAVLAFNKLTTSLNRSLRNEIYDKIRFKGEPLKNFFKDATLSNFINDPTTFSIMRYTRDRQAGLRACQIDINRKFVVVYRDDKKGSGAKVRAYLNNHYDITSAYLIPQEGLDNWLKANHVGLDELIPLSSIPDLPKIERASVSRRRAGIFAIKGGTTKTYFWKSLQDECPKSGYYFVKVGDNVIINEKERDIVNNGFYDTMKAFNLIPKDTYGISQTYLKSFQDFKPVEQYIVDKLKELSVSMNTVFANAFIDSADLNLIKNIWPKEDVQTHTIIDQVVKYKGFNKWQYDSILSYYNVPASTEPAISLVDKFKKYPLLCGFIRCVPRKDATEELAAYIKHKGI